MKMKITLLVLILALVSAACSLSINVPRSITGELVSFPINEEARVKNQPTNVELQVGAAELTIKGGASRLLEGEIRYNDPAWKPQIDSSAEGIVIRQPGLENLNFIPSGDSRNEWDLRIGSDPMNLTVNAGAYKGEMDLSDYAVKNFTVNDGASETKISFKTANKTEMDDLVYKTGASSVDLLGLGNANFEHMNLDCGAGSYTLDFAGDFKRDAFVNIQSGVSNIEIFIPEGLKSEINVGGGLNNIDLEGTWTTTGNMYSTEGEGPTLTINIDMGVGNVRLVNR